MSKDKAREHWYNEKKDERGKKHVCIRCGKDEYVLAPICQKCERDPVTVEILEKAQRVLHEMKWFATEVEIGKPFIPFLKREKVLEIIDTAIEQAKERG